MVNLLGVRDPEQWPVEVWDIGSVLAKRRALLYTEPIFSPEIMKYNHWLCQHADELTLDELLEIWAHSMWCVYLSYRDPDCDPELRRQTLLNLREQYNRYLKLPKRHQEKFWPTWRSIWDGHFLIEEGCWDGTT
jgi:hypothetical protein